MTDRKSTGQELVSTLRAYRLKRGLHTGKDPIDRGRPGSKHHIMTDRNGIPLAVMLSAANVHDSNMFEPLLDAVPALKNRHGRPTRRPQKLHADKGYNYAKCRAACIARRIKHRIARRGIENSSYLRKHRWVVEYVHTTYITRLLYTGCVVTVNVAENTLSTANAYYDRV